MTTTSRSGGPATSTSGSGSSRSGTHTARRLSGRVTTVSWIPSESVTGIAKLGFATFARYDDPPPDTIDGATSAAQRATLESWGTDDRFRFANQLSAWIDVDDDGSVVAAGYDGEGLLGSTTVRFGGRDLTFSAIELPVLRSEPEVGDGWVRFRQTAGGRTGAPMPRRISSPPFVQLNAPLVWTSLSLTVHTDGSVAHELTGASPFPRHWVYGPGGALAAKAGTTDFKGWYRTGTRRPTPWGDADSPALVTAVETALERQLAETIMRGGERPEVRRVPPGRHLVEQGSPGTELFLLLDGVLSVEVDGEAVAQIGPGVVIGERALLEGGRRTSTLRAVTACRVAAASADAIDLDAMRGLAARRRREHDRPT